MTPKLKEAAKTINALAKREEDARMALCRAIAGAMDLVKKESKLSWREWANQNLRKPDGSKWSMWTLYSYASFGRDPKKLSHSRKSIVNHGRNARKALQSARNDFTTAQAKPRTPEIPNPRPSGMILERQVEALMFAWRNAGAEARKIFMERISKDQAAA